jgi:hypothetical protein
LVLSFIYLSKSSSLIMLPFNPIYLFFPSLFSLSHFAPASCNSRGSCTLILLDESVCFGVVTKKHPKFYFFRGKVWII